MDIHSRQAAAGNRDGRTGRRYKVRDLTAMSLCLALIIAGAYIRIPLGFMTVTLQLVFAVLGGLLLGPGRTAAVCLTYILMGLAGLPVFAGGAGPGYILSPTFGYIIGFTLGTVLGGVLLGSRQADSIRNALVFTAISLFICYGLGALHYYIISVFYLGRQLGIIRLLQWTVFATLPKDLILGGAAALAAVRIRRHTAL